ncbi:MAG: chalcone isomerase family protein [Verrucomicrobia bacterium]|nr:chalcone isomerase family protein [Verrucomicrobiota bacterium]MDA1065634.1 chalcone isomerase family protein [Verrucomicrobiota bacterium]
MIKRIQYLILGLSIVTLTQVAAEPISPNTLVYDESNYVKVSSTSVKALGFIKLLTACLYVGEGYEVDDYPDTIPLALRLRYDRNFKKEHLIGSADEVLGDLYSKEELDEIEEHLRKINSAYLDVKKGDEYTLVHQPSRGTSLLFNGQEEVTIPGERFAQIYFSIWLGDHPKSRKLSRELLRQS